MQIFFIDDSEQEYLRVLDPFIGLGGIVIDESKISDCCADLADIRKRHSIPPDEEIKWSPRRNSWIYNNLVGDDRKTCTVICYG